MNEVCPKDAEPCYTDVWVVAGIFSSICSNESCHKHKYGMSHIHELVMSYM